MTERQGVYADHFSCTFKDPDEFLSFLRERKQNSSWMTVPSKNIQFQSIEADSPYGNLYMRIYQNNGRAEVLADTQENTCILLNVNGYDYPVRSCAIKTILERARISGHALSKVSTDVFAQILNHCMKVASGDSLVKVADEKVSAVHGGDAKEYAVLEMLPLFQKVTSYLDDHFPGYQFQTASFDHSLALAIWSLDGQESQLLDTYQRELALKGLTGKRVRPGLRFMTSDVGISGANLYPILLMGNGSRIIPLGYPIKTEHKSGVDLDFFDEQLDLLYARFKEAIEKQTKLLSIEICNPYTTMLGVLKRIGAPKKASYEAAEQFISQNGNRGCTAYELYLAMSEIIFMAQCDGASAGRIAQVEEIIARALSINWSEYDRAGDFKW